MSEPRCILLSEIVTDAGTQVRAELNESTVDEYAAEMLDGVQRKRNHGEKMKPEEIKAKLDAHAKWLCGDGGARANLLGANLRSADLHGANLHGADLSDANLRSADLHGAKNIPKTTAAQLMVPPQKGAYTGFKKCSEGVVELLIPADAERSSATTRKCRASKAIVVSLPDGCEVAHSIHDGRFCYRAGETVTPDKWEPDRWNECSGGIHHFITLEEAEDYQ